MGKDNFFWGGGESTGADIFPGGRGISKFYAKGEGFQIQLSSPCLIIHSTYFF